MVQTAKLVVACAAVVLAVGVAAVLGTTETAATRAPKAPDPCAFATPLRADTSPVGFASVEAVAACFAGVPLRPRVRNSTLAVLEMLVALYSFTDLAAGVVPPFNVSVDLAAELARVADAGYASDYAFHSDLQLVFARLLDGHTVYTPPTPYQQFLAFRPFILASTADAADTSDQPQRITVAGLASVLSSITFADAAVLANMSHSVPDAATLDGLVGQEIVAINGQPPLDYLVAQSRYYGVYKDPGYVRRTHTVSAGMRCAMGPVTPVTNAT